MSNLQPLTGITVVDFGVGMAAALVTKFLADSGARVVRIEPTEGDPFYNYYAAYQYWHSGAEIITSAMADTAMVELRLSNADICVLGGESFPGMRRAQDAQAIAALYPHLVILEITGNPVGLPGHGRPSTDLLAQARTGLCYEQFSERPLAMSFEPANYGTALQGICALLAAYYESRSSGLGQIANVSLFEGSLTWTGMYWSDFERMPSAAFTHPKDPHPLIFRCSDGAYVHLVLGSRGSKFNLYRALGIFDKNVTEQDSGLPNPSAGTRNFYGDVDLLGERISRHRSSDLITLLWDAGIPAELLQEPGQCWEDPQAQHNGIIVSAPDGSRYVGNPIIYQSVGADQQKKPRPLKPKAPATARPLEGVRVLDFGAYVAGPLASRVLADLGADVIKIEPPGGEAFRNMLQAYMVANCGKRGMTLDLKSPEGMAVVRRLVASADVVTSNFRGGVTKRLGIDPDSLHAICSDLVVLESPAYGRDGPSSQRTAFDLVMQAMCGHEIRAGGKGNEPLWNRTFMVDYAGGMLGAIGILSALILRDRTGIGASVEVPLFNAGIYLLSELVQRKDGSYVGAEPINAERTGFRPTEALYEGADGWIAVVARDEVAALALTNNLGIAESITRPSSDWGDYEGALISKAISVLSVNSLAERLEKEGVWTEICRRDVAHEILGDELFQARGNVRISRHPEYGRIREMGVLFTLSRSSTGSSRHLQLVDEHTQEILDQHGPGIAPTNTSSSAP